MAYQSLYRRFRPRNFDQIVGQDHITTTLKNQILNDNIAHAYLFSGTRGTGKTSTAKIFARAINCLNNLNGNPCNECESCKGILDDTVMDVVEMDAASNNSVDDIRELREKAKYPPSKIKYKVYIIDEVHMLSKGAFNALLKTLEEPPKHLIFILATTEPQKLPATILSRCQRFDFKRLTTNDIVRNMKDICSSLELDVEDRALHLIARNSDGAMRDALSILDQCVSFSEGQINYDYVSSVLGAVNDDIIFDIVNSIINKDLEKALELVNYIVENGKDVKQFIKDLILYFRNLMIVKSSNNVENIIDGSEDMIKSLREQGSRVGIEEIIYILNILSDTDAQSKWSSQPRIILEINIIKLISPKTDFSLEGLGRRVMELEKQITSGSITINQDSKLIKEVTYNRSVENHVKDNKEVKENKEIIKDKKEEKVQTSDIVSVDKEVNVSFSKIIEEWSNILKKIKSEKISLHALLMEGKASDYKDNTLIVAFGEGFGFHKDAIDKKENREYIENVLSKYFNRQINVRFCLESEISKGSPKDENKELIDRIKNVFGEDIVEIK